MKTISGSIPKKLFVGCQKQKKIFSSYWDIFEKYILKLEVNPAFVCDAENDKTKETVMYWAKSYDNEEPLTFEIDNTEEFTKETYIAGFEKRSEGGFAFKVIIKYGGKDYLFDLRHDTLLDIMSHSKIENGKISCPLVWARVGSQMKLIRKNSDIYNDIKQSSFFKELPDIPKKELKIDGVYRMANGKEFVYAGEVYSYCLAFDYSDREYVSYSRHPLPLEVKGIKRQLWMEKSGDHVRFDIIKGIKKVKLYCGQDPECYNKLLVENREFFNKYGRKEIEKLGSNMSYCHYGYIDAYLGYIFSKTDDLVLPEDLKRYFIVKE